MQANGIIKKVAVCRVKSYELIPQKDVANKNEEEIEHDYMYSVQNCNLDDDMDDKVVKDERMADVEKDVIGAKYLQIEKSVCFLENTVFRIEAPVLEHNRPEVKEAKAKEIQNLEDYETFEVVEYVGQ